LKLSNERYSPSLLRKISWVGGNYLSFQQASDCLAELLDMEIDQRQVSRITERAGKDLLKFQDYLDFVDKAIAPEAPVAAAIFIDGGRAQTRAENQAPGVHSQGWRETKVARLQVLDTKPMKTDPHPEVPALFLDKTHVTALVKQLGHSGQKPVADEKNKEKNKSKQPLKRPPRKKKKHKDNVIVNSCVARVASAEEFAPIVRNEAERFNLHMAPKKIFIGDGGAPNWAVHEKSFPHWPALLDFVHLVEHLFQVAYTIFKQADEAWDSYKEMITNAWMGKPNSILQRLKKEQLRIGHPEKGMKENHPKRILKNAIHYIEENKKRMDYPNARKDGLPTTSCYVESLIKQINQRVKATDKFWIVPNLQAVLQIRAAQLSNTRKWEGFWKRRYRNKYLEKLAA